MPPRRQPRLLPRRRPAVINALPAFALCLYGFLHDSLVGSMCFGAGLGITLFGCSYGELGERGWGRH